MYKNLPNLHQLHREAFNATDYYQLSQRYCIYMRPQNKGGKIHIQPPSPFNKNI